MCIHDPVAQKQWGEIIFKVKSLIKKNDCIALSPTAVLLTDRKRTVHF